MMRKPDKPSLQKMIMRDEDAVRKEDIGIPNNHVLGALFHRRFKGMKVNVVSEIYANYIRKNYRRSVTVVFDSYQDEGTKSHEHLQRNSIP